MGPGASPSASATPTALTSAAVTAEATDTPIPTPTATPVPSLTPSGPPVISGIACDVDEKTTYHVHAHLNIRFEGVLQVIPDDVGRTLTCLYWLHTHAEHGVIHVEAPAETPFTLGQFMDVWGQPLSATKVLGKTIGPGEFLYVYVDRQKYDADPRVIILGNLVAIELQIGPAPLDPLPYTFPAEFQ